MKLKLLILLFLICTLSGCVKSRQTLQMEALNSWMGYTEEEVIKGWGTPSRVYKAGDKKFLTFTSVGYYGNCDTTFTFQKDIAVHWSETGACR